MSVLSNYLKRQKLTQEELKKILHYDPETGIFTWKVRKSYNTRAGDKAGSIETQGYIMIKIERVSYKAHRLAWLYMKGSWPRFEMDHWNKVRDDNRWDNLREASHVQNMQNGGIRKDNNSGARGVTVSSGKWRAKITVNGKQKHLGLFNTVKEAKEAYDKAAREAFGEYYSDGFDHQTVGR